MKTPSSIRGALAAGFAVVLLVWAFAGYELIRSLSDVEQRVTVEHEAFARRLDILSSIRRSVLEGSIDVRDALIDPEDTARDSYREHLRLLRDDIDRQLDVYGRELERPIERTQHDELRATLAKYWESVDFVFSPALPTGAVQSASILRRNVQPLRRDILTMLDNLRQLQRLSQRQHDEEVAVLYVQARTRFLWIVASALLLGVAVAAFAFRRVGGLEAEIHRQRIAETHNRHDLERLSARLVEAQEQERRSLARELHDEVGQALTAIKMAIGVALRSTESQSRARAALDEARAIAETTLQGVRDLSQLLHPSMLDDFGLPETIEAYLRSFSKRTGIRAQFAHHGLDSRLPADVEVCIYRIVQEALTNVARHSGALTCSVTITRGDEAVDLVVEDSGRGIAALSGGSADARRGLGLMGMRERAQALAGRFTLSNLAEGGTRVAVTLPVPPAKSAVAPARVAV
jgi:signal transduction histidine kinase